MGRGSFIPFDTTCTCILDSIKQMFQIAVMNFHGLYYNTSELTGWVKGGEIGI